MKRSAVKCAALLVASILAVACQMNTPVPAAEVNLAERFQDSYIQPYVAGDIDRWMDVFADDVVALHDGLPALSGKDAVRGFGTLVSENFAITRMEAVVDEVRRKGDWAWTRGHFDTEFEAKTDSAPPGVAGERRGKFLLIWERQESGKWLVVMDMGNSLQTPQTAAQ